MKNFWTIAGITVLILFIIVYLAPNNFPSGSQRNNASTSSDNTAFQLFIAIAPTVIIVWLLWRMMRRAKPGVNEALSLGKNHYHTLTPAEATLIFKDIGGVEKAKAELLEIARFLKEPQTFA